MAVRYLTELKELREKIPVGISDGLRLLTNSKGNIEKAIQQIIEEYINNIQSKADVSPERALELLERCKYAPQEVLRILQDELDELTYTKTELILKRVGNDRYNAVQRVSGLLSSWNNMPWRENDDTKENSLSHLNKYQKCLVIICEWLDYEDDEGIEVAISLWPKLVQEQLSDILGFQTYGEALVVAYSIREEVFATHDYKKDSVESYIAKWEELKEDAVFSNAISYLNKNKQALIDRLYAFVQSSISHFP